jgi:hypothetical protein
MKFWGQTDRISKVRFVPKEGGTGTLPKRRAVDPLIGTELRGRTVSGLKNRMAPEGDRRRIQRGGEGASNMVRQNGKPLELKELRELKEFRGIVGGYSGL